MKNMMKCKPILESNFTGVHRRKTPVAEGKNVGEDVRKHGIEQNV